MRLSNTIKRLATGTYTVTRPAGSFTAGRWVEGTATTFEIVANIQPATPKELERLPEGQRTREVIAVWTDTELKTATVPVGSRGDRIAYGGASYEVQAVERWELGGYWKALAGKM